MLTPSAEGGSGTRHHHLMFTLMSHLTECVDGDRSGDVVTQLVAGVAGVVTPILHTDRVKQELRLITEDLIIKMYNVSHTLYILTSSP